jgi:hypothetical protein
MRPKTRLKIRNKVILPGDSSPGYSGPAEYDPLEEHPLWSYEGGEAGPPSHFKYASGKIIAKTWTNNPKVQIICYNHLQDVGGIFEADVTYAPDVEGYWFIPFTKQINSNNLIGARINNNQIQIVQRRVGTWSNIATAPIALGHWRVVITDADIAVYVDDAEQVRVNHAIPDAGYLGISGHKCPAEVEVLSGYRATALGNHITYKGNYVTHNTEQVTYNG